MKSPVTKASAAGRRAKRRGKVGERELAELLRRWGFAAKRGQQRSGLDQADVIGLPGWHIECKRVESLNVWAAFGQAARDAQAAQDRGEGEVAPLVAARRDRSPWLAVVRLEDFLALLVAAANPQKAKPSETREDVLRELLG